MKGKRMDKAGWAPIDFQPDYSEISFSGSRSTQSLAARARNRHRLSVIIWNAASIFLTLSIVAVFPLIAYLVLWRVSEFRSGLRSTRFCDRFLQPAQASLETAG
jgi:hypothetical protein